MQSNLNKGSVSSIASKFLKSKSFDIIKNTDNRKYYLDIHESINLAKRFQEYEKKYAVFIEDEQGNSFISDGENSTKTYPFSIKNSIFLHDGGLMGNIDLRHIKPANDIYMCGKLLDSHYYISSRFSEKDRLVSKFHEEQLLTNTPKFITYLLKDNTIYKSYVENGEEYYFCINKDKLTKEVEKFLTNRLEQLKKYGDNPDENNMLILKDKLENIVQQYLNFKHKMSYYIDGEKVATSSDIVLEKGIDYKNDEFPTSFIYQVKNLDTLQYDLYINKDLIQKNATSKNYKKINIQLNTFNHGNFFINDNLSNDTFFVRSDNSVEKIGNNMRIFFDSENGTNLKQDTLEGIYLMNEKNAVFYNGNFIGNMDELDNPFKDKSIFVGTIYHEQNKTSHSYLIKNGLILANIEGRFLYDTFYFKDNNNGNEYLIGEKDGYQVILKNFEIIKTIEKDKRAIGFYKGENGNVKVKIENVYKK